MDSNLERLQEELQAILADASPSQIARKTRPGKWCAAEILEHLSITYCHTARLFEKVLTTTQRRVKRRTLRDRAMQFVVITLGHMPHGRQAPDMTIPKGISPERVMSDVSSNLARMTELQAEVAKRFGRKKIGQHPVLGALTARQWAKFHWVHGRHHLKQVRELLAADKRR